MSHASAVEALLFAALEKPTAAERDAFLDSACGGDADLRRQVEKLLKAHSSAGDFLQKPVAEQLAAALEPVDATQRFVSTGPEGGPRERADGEGASDEDSTLDFLQPAARPDSLGRIGHYEVLQVLGKGGFGIVFRAFDEVLQRVVAIKVLSPAMAVTSPARKRFLREARSSAQIRHENVVQVYNVEEQPLPYLVMEFIPGETLQQRLDRTGPLAVLEVLRIGRQIAEGLAAAHATGLIHRDIKPANILIEAGPHQHVKITDFGLARAADDASLTQSGTIAGTPMFMAPEQAHGDALDHRADLFSLGSVLYTMASGRPPFRANNTLAILKRVAEDTPRPIPEIIPEVPPWLCDLIAQLHAKKPADRPGTAQEVADLLGRGLEALQRTASLPPQPAAAPAAVVEPPRREGEAPAEPLPQTARQEPRPPKPAARPRFHSGWAVAAAVFLALLGGLGITEATGVSNVRGTVIRLFSPEGTLEIQVDDPGVSVQIDGSDLVITGAGAREIRLKPGSYTVEARKDGQVVSRELVTVTKNGKQIVRVSQEARPTDPKAASKESLKDHTNTLGMKFRLIPAGKFTMGSSREEIDRCLGLIPIGGWQEGCFRSEGPEHQVEITRPFYVGETEVSVGQFRQFVVDNKYDVGDNRWANPGFQQTDDHPVVYVSWQNAVDFCKWLSAKEGNQYRLPREAEWEYCCRAGTKSRYSFGDNEGELSKYAWVGSRWGQSGDTDPGPQPVKQLEANPWHLRDMHGNVWEWCEDCYDPNYYRTSPKQDPPGPATGFERVIRGGAWNFEPAGCRSAFRNRNSPNFRDSNGGFRVVMVASALGDIGTETRAKEKGGAARTMDPDRRAAEYVLSIGGKVKVNERDQPIKAAVELPRESFRLTEIRLAGNQQGTDAGMAVLRDCKNLSLLQLTSTPVTDAGVTHIPNCRELWLQHTPLLTDAALAHLKECKGLWELHLVGLPKVTDAGLAHLKHCQTLTNLNLDSTPVTDAGLVQLKECKNLTWLQLHNNKRITDAGLVHLKGLDKLTRLNLSNTQATAKGVEELAKALPKCKIDWNGGLLGPK